MNILRNIQQTAKEVLQNEALILENLTNFVGIDFEPRERDFPARRPRLVTGIKANKIVATFNSAGTPSVFLHPANAVHGDPGIIQQEDLDIYISRSGKTTENRLLIPVLKRRGPEFVALVSTMNSCQPAYTDCVLIQCRLAR